ncbi:HD-GYP domain-containing protein [Desulfogranum marinum]|uniref:HD-GYP domain-containing protein n=1 Tax=Desulfogranum marinum TaxID=453220 RepID=UPI001964C026|nr:HD domain-containing protein [Desulfogranum marinum]
MYKRTATNSEHYNRIATRQTYQKMIENKGSIILKSVNTDTAQGEITAYLRKYAKNIPSDEIPELLQELPVVLARNVPELTARRVMAEMRRLSADLTFIPARQEQQKDTQDKEQHGQKADQRSLPATPKPSLRQITTRFNQLLSADSKKKCTESLIILSMLGIAWLLNYTVASQYLLLGFYSLPPVIAAYFFGRRHAVLTAFASILLVSLIYVINPSRFTGSDVVGLGGVDQWYHLACWGCILLITAYTMGSLYEKIQEKIAELRHTYQGILFILRHFISQDEYAENHCFRVSIYAVKIASTMGLPEEQLEDIRSAALLHDLGNLQIKREILEKASTLIQKNADDPIKQVDKETENLPDCSRGPLKKILPMLIGQRQGYLANHQTQENLEQARGASILAVADRYDNLVHEEFHEKPSPEQSARDAIISGTGKEFDPEVVKAFAAAFDKGEMVIPDIIV